MTGPLAAAWTRVRDIRRGAVIHWQGEAREVLGVRPGPPPPNGEEWNDAMRAAGTVPAVGELFSLYLPGEVLYTRGATILPVVAMPPRVGGSGVS